MTDPTGLRLFPQGGARRRRGEESTFLTLRQCRAVIDGASRAGAAGTPFNRFITLLWERGGLAGADATAATRSFVKLASDWMRLPPRRLCWAYVHEWGARNGAHAHVLLHVPPDLKSAFGRMPLQWAKSILPSRYVAGVVDTKIIPGADAPGDVSWDLYGHSLTARIHYMLKAAPAEMEAELSISEWGRSRWGQSSRVFGKRAGAWVEHS
jgi:hypothetical protein